MILYEGGEDIPVREVNTSTKYYTGSYHNTLKHGKLQIVAQIDKQYVRDNGRVEYRYYIGRFDDGTLVKTNEGSLYKGKNKNPNNPILYDRGFIGQGKWKVRPNGVLTKEYVLWNGMLRRCYDEKSYSINPTYKECEVDERWFNFQTFCEDIQCLDGYTEWKKSKGLSGYHLDKDIKVKGNKEYGPTTCIFVPASENLARYNKTQTITGKTYIATRLSDGYEEEFTNQTEFAEKYNLLRSKVSACINKRRKTHLGWKFHIKEE